MRNLLVVLGLVASIGGATATAQPAMQQVLFVLSVDQLGSYFITAAGRPLQTDDSEVVEQTLAALNRDASTALIIEADASAPYNRVTRAAQLLQQGGATRVGFRTKTP